MGLKSLWSHKAIVDRRFTLEQVHNAVSPADVCTNALPGDRIRELCRLACVLLCHNEDEMGADPGCWSVLVGKG